MTHCNNNITIFCDTALSGSLFLSQTASLSAQRALWRTEVFMKKEDSLQHKYYITRSKKLTEFSLSVERRPCECVLQALKSAGELEERQL